MDMVREESGKEERNHRMNKRDDETGSRHEDGGTR